MFFRPPWILEGTYCKTGNSDKANFECISEQENFLSISKLWFRQHASLAISSGRFHDAKGIYGKAIILSPNIESFSTDYLSLGQHHAICNKVTFLALYSTLVETECLTLIHEMTMWSEYPIMSMCY